MSASAWSLVHACDIAAAQSRALTLTVRSLRQVMRLQGVLAGLKAKQSLGCTSAVFSVSYLAHQITHRTPHVHCAGQKAAAYVPGTDANRESKDRQYEEGYRSPPGTGTGNDYGSTSSGYGTASSQNTSGTGGMTTGEPDLPCFASVAIRKPTRRYLGSISGMSKVTILMRMICHCFSISSSVEAHKAQCVSRHLDVHHKHPDYETYHAS